LEEISGEADDDLIAHSVRFAVPPEFQSSAASANAADAGVAGLRGCQLRKALRL
jgi:hypothetical protein